MYNVYITLTHTHTDTGGLKGGLLSLDGHEDIICMVELDLGFHLGEKTCRRAEVFHYHKDHLHYLSISLIHVLSL